MNNPETHYELAALPERRRIAWAPALANGAALLSLIGMVSNLPDVDFAFRQLTPILICLAVGAGAGLVSVEMSESADRLLARLRAIGEVELPAGVEAAKQLASLEQQMSQSEAARYRSTCDLIEVRARSIREADAVVRRFQDFRAEVDAWDAALERGRRTLREYKSTKGIDRSPLIPVVIAAPPPSMTKATTASWSTSPAGIRSPD
ncbi:MAG: hypothetical protein ACK4YQ_17000 [Phenylobacterium sp.]|uniref:hypothetical protein n=1 Tax=Phenylobacterium sp. TaxID=1871053 RepID=UPI00391D14DC